MKSRFELLAPAGSFDALKAAIAAGCDAVYCGGNMFGARAFANNFSTEELIEAIDYCHIYGKQLYLTVNTLLKNDEIDELLYNYIKPLYEAGLDAVIVQDLGVLRFIKAHFPDLELHASTQMTILGDNFANELKDLGVKRVVTPRELSLSEIRNIYDKTGMEIETFIHGALCYCYSGQCLMSSLIGQRSGNRGKCAQPCRLPYKLDDEKNTEYYLSPKDLCALENLPDILEAGIYSLKIEGRMKNPEYVSVVTSIYRKYINIYESKGREGYSVDKADINKLMDIYNRGGFTDGFFKIQNSDDIIYTKRPNHMGVKAGTIKSITKDIIYFDNIIDLNKNDVLEFRLKNNEYVSFNLGSDFKKNSKCNGFLYKKGIKSVKELYNTDIYRTKNSALNVEMYGEKLTLNCNIIIKKDEDIVMTVYNDKLKLSVSFDAPSEALKQSLTKEVIIKQLQKTGNEAFDFKNINVELDEGLFLPMGVLNNIRRDGLNKFKEELLDSYRRTLNASKNTEFSTYNANTTKPYELSYSALVTNIEQLKVVLNYADIKNVYVEQAFNSYEELTAMCQMIRNAEKTPYLAIAHITRNVFSKDLRNNLKFYLENDYEGYMFRNLETFFMLKNSNIDLKNIVFDSHIYAFNNYSYDYYKELGAMVLTGSYEQNLKDLKNMNKDELELNIYGYIPVMLSANCIRKTTRKCNSNFKNEILNSYSILKDRVGAKLKVVYNCRYCYNIIYNDVPLSAYNELNTLQDDGYTKFRLNFTIENKEETKNILEYYLNKDESLAPSDYTKGHLKRGV